MTGTVSAAPVAGKLRAYVRLTKPRIIELLLITTVPAMILAARGWPGWGLTLGTVGGGALVAGGANAINNVADRDIDARMRRTASRPLPTAAATPREALVLGLVLGAVGYVVLLVTANAIAAALATGALGFYVLVYTLYLKRTTPQNIVIGGAAGAIPAVVGWAAVTGSISVPAWLMFAVVFYWTPPHFWALALRFRADYQEAGVPMLPVVAGERATAVQIVLYTGVVCGVSLLLQPAAGLGMLYVAAAVTLGIGFFAISTPLLTGTRSSIRVFRFSNVYLAALFGAVALDALVADPTEPMSGLAWAAAAIVVLGSAAIVAASRPKTLREIVLVLLPAAGAVALALAVLSRI